MKKVFLTITVLLLFTIIGCSSDPKEIGDNGFDSVTTNDTGNENPDDNTAANPDNGGSETTDNGGSETPDTGNEEQDTNQEVPDETYEPSEAGDHVLYNPNGGTTTTLMNMDRNIVHTWDNLTRGGYAVYLLNNGHILRPASASNTQINGAASAGLIQEIDWDGNLVWEFEYNSATYLTHHDIEPMPNGNVLFIAWDVISASDATAAGRTTNADVWPDSIVEIKPNGSGGADIVWEWHAWII